MSDKKLNIKEMLEQAGVKTPPAPAELSVKETVSNVPEGLDLSQVEGSTDDNGFSVEESEIVKAKKNGGVPGNIISEEQMKYIQETLDDMDVTIDLANQEFAEFKAKQEEEAEKKRIEEENSPIVEDDEDDDDLIEKEKEESIVDPSLDRETFKKKYEEAVVIIDKTGIGQVVNFTDAERKKLEKVKKIKLEEVETVELGTLKRKKAKKGSAEKILKKVASVRTTQIVLPISGFTAVMRGCSTFELLGLVAGRDANVTSLIAKWTLIHSKVEDTSIGKMDFNTFLSSVSQMEYDMFVYGILCATYPEVDTFPLECEKCKREIEHKYTVRTLLRAEEMSERLAAAVRHTVDNSYTEEAAKECFETSLLNTTETIKLPNSEYVCDISVQTAYSFIHDSINAIEKMESKYNQAAMLASSVLTLLVPDPDSPGEYFEIEDTEDIIKIIYSLNNLDISVLGTKIGKLIEGMNFSFGLMDINCDNPKCRNHVNTVDVDLDSILFIKYQQAMNTTIE